MAKGKDYQKKEAKKPKKGDKKPLMPNMPKKC